VVDHCESHGIAFIPWFPLGAGKVAGEVLNEVARAHQATSKQVALAWLLRRSPIMLPIPGTSSVEHLAENVAGAAVHITDDEFERLAEVPELVASR
jgi:pyridoxine 4-dehydrogenase